MRPLITGRGGKSGSWAVRAVQLGAALGAEVQAEAEVSDCRSARIVVGVKRITNDQLKRIKASFRPFVWDVVDAWPQPGGNEWSREQSLAWLHSEIERLAPQGIVFGTRRMQQDAGFSGESIVLPHHAWPKYQPVNVRHTVQAVGYEGAESYLGRWRAEIQAECDRRGWRFVVNGDLSQCDIGIALRDCDGYAPKHWKPGTKLSNLQALGLPALLSPECGYKEQSNGTEYWISHPDHITRAFNELACPEVRSAISIVQQQSAPRMDDVAKDYAEWLLAVSKS